MVKYAANRPLKNITSEPSQIMTPTASSGGRSGTWRGARAGCSTDRACVTASFLADRDPSAPTPQRCRQRPRVDDGQTTGGAGESDVQSAQALGRLLDDGGRLHHDHGVELEAVGQVDGQQTERRPQAVPAGVGG